MKTVNRNNVKTKEDLINMLFTFHNTVNRRLGKSQFTEGALVMYDNYRIDVALVNFINGYSSKYGSIMSGMISTLGKRQSTAKAIQGWMQNNWRYFQT